MEVEHLKAVKIKQAFSPTDHGSGFDCEPNCVKAIQTVDPFYTTYEPCFS